MKRVTRAKRAAKSTAVDSPAEDAADNDVECSKSPVIKSKRKSRKEEVVDSNVEEDKEVEEKKSKKKGKKKTSSSKRKSRSSKFYDNHSSEEASAEDVGENTAEVKKSKSDKHKQHKNQKQDKQEQELQEQEVQEKHDQEATVEREKIDQQDCQSKKIQEKRELDKNNQEKKDPERNCQVKTVQEKKESERNSRERTNSISQEKKVQEKNEFDKNSQEQIYPNRNSQDRIDEEIKSAKKDVKKGQDHKESPEHNASVENESKQESQIENITKLDTLTEEITKVEGQTKNNINSAQEGPIQDNFIKQSEQITQQDVKPIQDSMQDVLTEKVTESDREIEKILEPKTSEQEIEKPSKPKVSEQAVRNEDAQKKHVQEKKYPKPDTQERKRRDRKVSDDSDKKSTQEQEKSKKSSKQISLESPGERENETKLGDTNDENTLNKSDVVSSQEESTENGPSTPFVLNRKRKWGSRPAKITIQKSLTISTDVLKDIIPDVKPVEFDEVIEHKKHDEKRRETEKIHKPILPKIVIDNTIRPDNMKREEEGPSHHEPQPLFNRKVSIVKENDIIMKPLSPPRNKSSSILYITNLVRPFTLPQLKNLLQRTGRIVEDGFWIDRIKSKCYVKYETEDQAVETRHALHGVTWPISNPKALQVDFSTEESFDKAKISEENPATPISTIPGTVEDWLREQDLKRARDELDKPWQRKAAVREWDVGKGEKEKELPRREEKPERRRHRTPERHSPEPARKFKKKEDEAPAKLLDDLFRKTKTTPCIYWLPLSSETIAVKEEQRRVHMLEHERRMQEIRRQRRH